MSSFPPGPGEDTCYYALLNVPKSAGDEDIRKAYRSLAQVYHPDKHQDVGKQQQASVMFTKVLEAYEVLSDPVKREVYDVYGKEGLAAGLAVGEHLDRDELRKEWAAFQAAKKEEAEGAVEYSGAYIFHVDASPLVDPYPTAASRAGGWSMMAGAAPPELSSASMSNTVTASLTHKDVAYLGGSMVLHRGEGEGGFVCGYKRQLTADDSLQAGANLGLRSLISLTSTRQLTDHDTGSITMTWQPQAGVGLQVMAERKLTDRWAGEYRWTLGPYESSAMGLGLTRRTASSAVSMRMDAGLRSVGATLRARIKVAEGAFARFKARLALTDWVLELGGLRAWGGSAAAATTLGLTLGLGSQGVQLRLHVKRGSQAFEFPILLSPLLQPWLAAAALLLPPVAIGAAKAAVWDPLDRWSARRKMAAAMRTRAAAVRQAEATAMGAQELLLPVAQRKAAAEASREGGGLVVLAAYYGCLPQGSLPLMHRPVAEAARERPAGSSGSATTGGNTGSGGGGEAQQLQQQEEAEEGGPAAAEAAAAKEQDAAGQQRQREQQQQEEEERGLLEYGRQAGDSDSGGGGSAMPAAAAAGAGGAAAAVDPAAAVGAPAAAAVAQVEEVATPVPWIDVTVPVRYLVDGGRLRLHAGISKSGLLGFCDPCPGQPGKALRVEYAYCGRLYYAVVGDDDACDLPAQGGRLLTDAGREAELARAAQEEGLDLRLASAPQMRD